MKKLYTFFCFILIPIILSASNKIDSLLNELDKTVDNYQFYSNQKEEQLNKLKELLNCTSAYDQRYQICGKLFDEYKVYKSDSSLTYARKKLEIAEKLNNPRDIIDSQLNLADIMGITGLYKESMDVLASISINDLHDLKPYYFYIYRTVYGFMADYTISTQAKRQYENLINAVS